METARLHAHSDAMTDLRRACRDAGGYLFAAVLIGAAIFVLSLFHLRADKIFALPANLDLASREDIAGYWRAAQLALQGSAADAYDAATFRAGLPTPNDGLLWLNPPHFLLALTPLAVLPYAGVKVFWIAASAAALLAIVRMTAPRPIFFIAITLSPAAFASLLVMQSGPFVAALLAGALINAKDRPLLAGLLLALLTMKPQYGFLAPVFLFACGNWRAFLSAAVCTIALVACSAALFGIDAWSAFFTSVSGGATAGHGANLHRDMVTIHQTVGKLGGGETARAAAQLLTMGIGAIAVFVAARRWPRDAAIGFTLLASAFVSPSLWVYDWPLVAAGLFMLARAGSPWPPHLQALAALLWVAPLISLGFGGMESAVAAPFIFAAALAGFWSCAGAWQLEPTCLSSSAGTSRRQGL